MINVSSSTPAERACADALKIAFPPKTVAERMAELVFAQSRVAVTEIRSGVIIETYPTGKAEWPRFETRTHCANGADQILSGYDHLDAALIGHQVWVNIWRAKR